METQQEAGLNPKYWTTQQKIQYRKGENKAWAYFDLANEPFDKAYFSYAETLYPERDRKIQDAENIMQQKIDEAVSEFEMTRKQIMDEFESDPELVRLGQIRDEAREKNRQVFGQSIINLKKKLGLL